MMDTPRRSGFVTGLAWIFIAVSGYLTLTAVLQNVMVAHFLPQIGFDATAGDVRIPAVIRFMFGHMQLVAAVILLLAATTLAASIGLLKRENWARQLFIVLMALGIAWNVMSLIMPQLMLSGVAGIAAPASFREQLVIIRVVVFVVSLVEASAFSAVFWWIIRKLRSAPIVAEFTAGGAALA